MAIYANFAKDKKKIFFKFIRFLKEEKIFNAFKNAVNNNYNNASFLNSLFGHSLGEFFLRAPIYQWINWSIKWGNTKEGYTFWENVDKNWKKCIDEI